VVDITMIGLIGSNGQDDISHRGALVESPIGDGELGSRLDLPRGEGGAFGVNLVDSMGVSSNSLLFDVTHESVAELGPDEVDREETVHENSLGSENHQSHEPTRLANRQERQQMHSFVLGLLEESSDPAVVSLHGAKSSQVTNHGSHETRHGGDSLEEDKASHPGGLTHDAFLGWRVALLDSGAGRGMGMALFSMFGNVARDQIETLSNEQDRVVGSLVGEVFDLSMFEVNVVNLLFGVHGMEQQIVFGLSSVMSLSELLRSSSASKLLNR